MRVSRRRLTAFMAAAAATGCAAPLPETEAAGTPTPMPQLRLTGQRVFQADSDFPSHRTLPFGTAVRVTNLRNGTSTVVVIRDRGPFTPGRIMDLSPRTTREIGAGGITPVELAPVGLRSAGTAP